MLCRNCQQEIGNKNACPNCGFNPALDDENAPSRPVLNYYQPQPIHVVLKKSDNRKARAAFVLSFFGVFIIPGIISLVFALQGFFQAKNLRTGRGKSIAALAILLIWAIIYIVTIKNM